MPVTPADHNVSGANADEASDDEHDDSMIGEDDSELETSMEDNGSPTCKITIV